MTNNAKEDNVGGIEIWEVERAAFELAITAAEIDNLPETEEEEDKN